MNAEIDPEQAESGPHEAQRRGHYRFNLTRQKAYLDHLRGGLKRTAAAEAIGISRQVTWQFSKDHEWFRLAVEQAELDAASRDVEEVEDALKMAALSGNVTAIQVFLYNRAPDKWGDRRNVTMTVRQTKAIADAEIARMAALTGVSEAEIRTEFDLLEN